MIEHPVSAFHRGHRVPIRGSSYYMLHRIAFPVVSDWYQDERQLQSDGRSNGMSSRPSEPQSVAAFPSLFWCISVCGLFRTRTRFWRTELPNTSGAILTSTAATLLPPRRAAQTGWDG